MELSEILIIAFTGVVALSTVAYALLTWRLVSETQKLRRAQTEPRVSARVEIDEWAGRDGLELVIRNEGQGPASNIRFDFEGDPTYFIGSGQLEPIDQISVIKNGLPHLGPGQTFRLRLGWLIGEAFDRANQVPWTLHISFRSLGGTLMRGTYVLDFSQFAGTMGGDEQPLVKIERHLNSLQKDVHHLLTGFNKPQIITQTKGAYREEMEQRRRERSGGGPVDSASDTDSVVEG